ncbi:MAG: glycoside hydrolase family 172 protein [Vicinamibacterales bacterium]
MATGVRLVVLGSCLVAATVVEAQQARHDLDGLPFLRSYTSARVSSADPTGANDDGLGARKIAPGETRTIADLRGPGIISHIWFTIATTDRWHLKNLVLRMYWDGEATPSVESPIGDFFGLGLGRYFLYESGPLSVGSQKALNAYFPMPFRSAARVTVTNEGEQPVGAFYFNIDYEQHASLPADLGYFHAQYRQATPNKGWTTAWTRNGDASVDGKPNLRGEDNYVILDAEGRGHYVGVTHSILQNQGDWWGEGDDMFFIDGASTPQINGTGSEDYYLGAWCYGGCGIDPFGTKRPTFAYQRYGNPLNGGDDRGAEWMVYRFHTDSPVAFQKSLRVTIESGHANHRSDNFFTVAFWYQTEPHKPFPALPPAALRVPKQIDTGGPTMGRE